MAKTVVCDLFPEIQQAVRRARLPFRLDYSFVRGIESRCQADTSSGIADREEEAGVSAPDQGWQ